MADPDDNNVTWPARRLRSNGFTDMAKAIRMIHPIAQKYARLQGAILWAALAGAFGTAAAQDNAAPPQGDHAANPGGAHGPQTLTPGQSARVGAILKAYKPATVSVDDAKAIHRAFRDADIRPGPGLHDAIRAAGFDPDKLRSLDPPPPRPQRDEPGQGGGDARK